MKYLYILIIIILVLPVNCPFSLNAQPSRFDDDVNKLEQQYEEYISGALRFQVKADSLSRTANQKRMEIGLSDDAAGRREIESDILYLERESLRVQKQADSLYSKARAVEIRLMAGLKENHQESLTSPENGISGQSSARVNDEVSAGSGSPRYPRHQTEPLQEETDLSDEKPELRQEQPGSSQEQPGSSQEQPGSTFVTLGDKDISSMLTRNELSLAAELQPDYERAGYLMRRISDMNNEMEKLSDILDSNPSRRERRRMESRLGELTDQYFDKKMEAMQIYEKVNALRFTAGLRFLEETREGLSDSVIIRSGLAYEQKAIESFNQARKLRETSVDLLSDRYHEEFMVKAFKQELEAFYEMSKALDVYNTSLRESALEADLPAARKIDFGFSVLPESPYSDDNPIPGEPVLPGGIVYTIQLGIYNALMTPGYFGGINPVMSERETDSRSVSYFAGVFKTLSEAERGLIQVNRQGFSDAFIVAYNNGQKIPVTRASQIERAARPDGAISPQEAVMHAEAPPTEAPPAKTPAMETPPAETPSAEASPAETPPIEAPPSDAPSAAANPEIEKAIIITYRIQLGAFSRPLQPDISGRWQRIAEGKNIEYTLNNRGLYVYSTGNFNNFEEALRIRDRFRKQEVPDAFIVPYRDDMRISIEEVNQLMRNQ